MEKDPYYTYTDYWPCKPVQKASRTVLVLVLAAIFALAGAVYFGAELLNALSLLGG